jgi:hypothetical protein
MEREGFVSDAGGGTESVVCWRCAEGREGTTYPRRCYGLDACYHRRMCYERMWEVLACENTRGRCLGGVDSLV